jgi:chemotaxis protein methyltransferase CheR
LRELPPSWVEQCFEADDSHYCVKGAYRTGISFHCQDIRETMPRGRFDVILCRNLVFTYFLPELQEKVLEQITRHLTTDGVLVIGAHEKLPARSVDYCPLLGCRQILHRRPGNAH